MNIRAAMITTAPTKIRVRGSLLRERGLFPMSSGSSTTANPVYPTSSLSTAPTTFPVPNNRTFSFLIVVSPSVTSILYAPFAEISFRIFSSPALMFCA